MVDNGWRDSFVVKPNRVRYAPAEHDYKPHDESDLSSLLELEKKANLAKPSGGDGLFAGTSFDAPTKTSQSHLISKGLTMSSQAPTTEQTAYEDILREHSHSAEDAESKGRRGKSIYNRATLVLESFAERLSSSGGGEGGKRRSSKESDREASADGDRRKSTTPARVKSVVAKLAKGRSLRKSRHDEFTAHAENAPDHDESAAMPEVDSHLSSSNPKFAHTPQVDSILSSSNPKFAHQSMKKASNITEE